MARWLTLSLVLAACGAAPIAAVATPSEPSAPLSLLGGRLGIAAPVGATLRQRPHSIMGAPEPEDLESFVWLEEGEDRFGLIVRELFLRCGDDFAATVRAVLASSDEPLPEPYETRALGGSMQVILLVPARPERREDAAAVLEAGICHPDGSVQWARAMVAGADLDRLIARARERAIAMLGTLRPGQPPRASSARRLELETYSPGHALVAPVPDGWVSYVQEGPDFRVHYLRRLEDRPGGPVASIGLYLGDHPSFHGGGTGTLAGTLLGRPVEWRISESQEWRRIEAIASSPGPIGTAFVHAFGGASDEALLAEVRTILESLALAD